MGQNQNVDQSQQRKTEVDLLTLMNAREVKKYGPIIQIQFFKSLKEIFEVIQTLSILE